MDCGTSGQPPDVCTDRVRELLSRQAGVVSRRQVLLHGGTPGDIERMLRRREWVRVLPGVYVDHTGALSWQQRAWAGVLFHWPAALAHDSALRAGAGPGWRRYDDLGPVQLAVHEDRKVAPIVGYRVRRIVRFEEKVQWNLGPPRMRVEEAALDVAAERPTEFGAIEVLAEICQSRRTTAVRMLEVAATRQRLRRRRWLAAVLEDISEGSCSVLESGYLNRVERSHALPRARRQVQAHDRGTLYRDVEYAVFGLIVELDGRLFHDTAGQRDRDLDRDLVAAVAGQRTVRLGWGQVYARPCWTAQQVASLLRSRGWQGTARRCGDGCTLVP